MLFPRWEGSGTLVFVDFVSKCLLFFEFVIRCCISKFCNCSSVSNFPQNVVMFLGIRIWRLWGSTFFGKGTAETRLFGEGKVVKFRKVHLDRGWCNIQHRLGWGGVGSWFSNLLLKTKREIFRRGLWEDFGRSSNRVCLHSIIYTCIY